MLVLHCITSVLVGLSSIVIIGAGVVVGLAVYLKTKPKNKIKKGEK